MQEEVKTRLEAQQKVADEAKADKERLISRVQELEEKVCSNICSPESHYFKRAAYLCIHGIRTRHKYQGSGKE